ncbi:NADH-quinone oxidoreductase subunit NuoK [Hydrogenimonas urashimensis]|uniref:NADH-quinone oxidoreductase subunit NuoK n=1 Tax=Hydrogenimonas urashimensis TaxID=2740515 RepID=UPI0019152DB3|nr:NADH-quinone oxidoreductase subunit K [Hydrogenimonas urashimensis]
MFGIEMVFAFALFGLGVYGVGSRRDFLRIFFSLEMMVNAVILMLALSARHLGLSENIELAYLIIVLATLEAAAGLLIFGATHRITRAIRPDDLGNEERA